MLVFIKKNIQGNIFVVNLNLIYGIPQGVTETGNHFARKKVESTLSSSPFNTAQSGTYCSPKLKATCESLDNFRNMGAERPNETSQCCRSEVNYNNKKSTKYVWYRLLSIDVWKRFTSQQSVYILKNIVIRCRKKFSTKTWRIWFSRNEKFFDQDQTTTKKP